MDASYQARDDTTVVWASLGGDSIFRDHAKKGCRSEALMLQLLTVPCAVAAPEPGIKFLSIHDLVCLKSQEESILGLAKLVHGPPLVVLSWRFQSFQPFNRCAPFKSFGTFRTPKVNQRARGQAFMTRV